MLVGFGEDFGVDRETALRLGRGFGSGMGLGKTCGALTGAVLALGFKVQDARNENEARHKTYELVRNFIRRFEAIHGTSDCSSLLGIDMSTESGRREAQERRLYVTRCPAFVKDAARLLRELP